MSASPFLTQAICQALLQGKNKNPEFLEMFVLKMQINIFLFISSHVAGSVSYTKSAWRSGAYLTPSGKGCEGSGGPFKISLKSAFNCAKGEGVEWVRTHTECGLTGAFSLCPAQLQMLKKPVLPSPLLLTPSSPHCRSVAGAPDSVAHTSALASRGEVVEQQG